MAIKLVEIRNRSGNLPLRVAKGHFATSHSHINYYVDLTMTKHRLSEARQAAQTLWEHGGNAVRRCHHAETHALRRLCHCPALAADGFQHRSGTCHVFDQRLIERKLIRLHILTLCESRPGPMGPGR